MPTESTRKPDDDPVGLLEQHLPDEGVFHTGEIAVQQRTGERSLAERRGAMIRDRLIEGARHFLGGQGVAAVSAAAPDGTLWASLWCGEPGFLQGDELGERVQVVSVLDRTLADDPVHSIVRAGAPLGMVVIDFETRRRLRVNGVVERVDGRNLELRVRETFGNCIKYIQRRHRSNDSTGGVVEPVEHGSSLDDDRRAFIARTDTLFVASMHPRRGLDVSHRGGHPGFVHVKGDRALRIPDYEGNAMYQTFGNFATDSRAGLALIDFDRRRLLSLTGKASVEFDAEDIHNRSGGTGRYWSFTLERWVEFSLPSTMTWTLIERSPFNPISSRY